MKLPAIQYHYFRVPLPYKSTLALQERIHAIQLEQRRLNNSHKDILLLLEHRPVYTAGRRQREDSVEIQKERDHLIDLGADFVHAARGGETTYHGPGQIVGYPLLDLSRSNPTMGIRDYICFMQKALKLHLKEAHGITTSTSENTGVFLNPTTKIASIGVQVRHRLTTHGFSLNVTSLPGAWFSQVVACGLPDVKAGSIQEATGQKDISVKNEIQGLVKRFGEVYGREIVELDVGSEGEIGEAIEELEHEALQAGPYHNSPVLR